MKHTTTTRMLSLLTVAAAAAACGSEVSSTVLARSLLDDAAAPVDGATPDGAAPDDAAAPVDAAPPWMPPAGTNTACVSDARWTRGNRGSSVMNPGQACVSCHVRMAEGPTGIGGTAYYLDHEENNCNGYTGDAPGGPSGAAYVEVVDADGTMLRLRVGRTGNFGTSAALVFPLRSARVVGPTGLVNEMSSPVPNGDCNSCHTQAGTTTEPGGDPAPGRITVPL